LISSVQFNSDGLVPVIAQDAGSGQVLMFAWMDETALQETVASGQGDVLLMKVEQQGGVACHTGRAHCFYRTLDTEGQWQTTEAVIKEPSEMYGNEKSSN